MPSRAILRRRMTSASGSKLRVLVRHSGSSKDEPLARELLDHLRPLVRFAGIQTWSDADIRPGDETRRAIERAIDQADVALLLLSADFLASDAIHEAEVPKLLDRHRQGALRVIPVVLRSCLWDVHPWLKELRPLPRDHKPIASHQGDERDRVMMEVVREVAEIGSPTAGATPSPSGSSLPASPAPMTGSGGSTFITNIHGGTFGALAFGEGAKAVGDVTVRAMPDAPPTGATATSKLLPLVAFGPRVITEGERIAATGSTWTIRVHRFLLGDTSALCELDPANSNIPEYERYVVLSEPGEGRALAGPISWRAADGHVEVQAPVAPPHLKYSPRHLRDVSLDLSREVHGAEAAANILVTCLGTPYGMLQPGFGTHFVEWWPDKRLTSRLADLIRLEIARFASIPKIDVFTCEVYLPFGFLEQVVSVRPRPDDADLETLPVDLELIFVGGEAWRGEVRVALQKAVPLDMEAMAREITNQVLQPQLQAMRLEADRGSTPRGRPTTAKHPAPKVAPALTPASVYLAYADADLPFAQKLFEALEAAGVPVFFREEHAFGGEKHHRTSRKGINDCARVLLVCSQLSLTDQRVLNELEETLAREAREGGAEIVIPLRLDGFVTSGWRPSKPDVVHPIRDRYILDFEGAERDRAKWDRALKRLLGALKG